jgi:hypothetical protein
MVIIRSLAAIKQKQIKAIIAFTLTAINAETVADILQ